MGYYLRIGGGVELYARLLQGVPQDVSIDEIAVVGHRHRAIRALYNYGLGIIRQRGARGGITGVANGDMPRQVTQILLIEHLGHQAHARTHVDTDTISSGDASGLLPAMLEGIDAIEGKTDYIFSRSINPKDAALLLPLAAHHAPNTGAPFAPPNRAKKPTPKPTACLAPPL